MEGVHVILFPLWIYNNSKFTVSSEVKSETKGSAEALPL